MTTNGDRGNPKLPEGYYFGEDGLGRNTASQGGGERRKMCCDSIPVDIEKVILKDDISGTIKESYRFSVEDVYGNKTGPMICTVEEMRAEKLLDKIYQHVILGIYQGAGKEAGRVFEQTIKKACVGAKVVEVYVNKFGWHGNQFVWDKPIEADIGKEYASAVDICRFAIEHDVIIVALLGAVHGFMKKPLQEAGIRHDYVDVLVGSSGIGKSDPLKAICNYHVKSGNIYSVGSNRKAVQMQMERNTDQTVVLDDFCKTKSDRVSATQDQLVSEIIQVASDAARVIIDKDSKAVADPALRRHIMLSAERIIFNESTINRCFIYYMQEPLLPDAFRKMKILGNEGGFFRFLVAMSRFIGGDNFTSQIEMMSKDYERYKSETDRLGTCTCGSDHRINETCSVQMVLVRVIIQYLNNLKLDEALLKKTDKAFADNEANFRGLSSDLHAYSLSYVDNEGKLSCHWGTKKRYYHVRVKELLELIDPDIDFMTMDRIRSIFGKEQ